MAGGTPDIHSRAIPSAWTAMDSGANIQEALEALETYKKKDGAKGTQFHTLWFRSIGLVGSAPVG